MKTLVVCEKPSVAADVARALTVEGPFERRDWGFESAKFVVTAAAGHLVAEAPPERYDERFKKWDITHLPIIPERVLVEPRDDRARRRLADIASLLARTDVTRVVNACDAGREGELIFKLIAEYVGCGKRVERAWFSSMTTQAIREAFTALRADGDMEGLEQAARARSHADWLVGMNATRAATCHLASGRQLVSVGRVQTPTLAMVVRRDVTIEEFEPEKFFQVDATFSAAAGLYVGKWMGSREATAVERCPHLHVAEEVAAKVRAQGAGHVDAVEQTLEVAQPPKLFDLTELQREANKRFGYTASDTLASAQACYETHKILSYPRTDSRFLTTDMVPGLAGVLDTVAANVAELVPAVTAADRSRFTSLVDDGRVNDHHAIIPTVTKVDVESLPERDRTIYLLVCRRFVAALHEARHRNSTTIWTRVAAVESDIWFRTVVSQVVNEGWMAVERPAAEEEDSDDESAATVPSPGEHVGVEAVDVVEGETSPPERFNEASLLGSMSSAGKNLDDENLAEALKERGLGTPATRAAVIERLIDVGYLDRKGRRLLSTLKGRRLIEALDDHPLTSPELTGTWEERLQRIEKLRGEELKRQRASFEADLRAFVSEMVAGLSALEAGVLADTRQRLFPCPLSGCGGSVVENSRSWVCDSWKSKEDPGCGFAVWKQKAGKKVTVKQLERFAAEIRSGKRTFFPPGRRPVLAACPRCAADVVEREKSWGCTSFRSPEEPGCGYVIWKKSRDGRIVTAEQARSMCESGVTNAAPPPKLFSACPRCGGRLLDRGTFVGCDSWKSKRSPGCGTFAARVVSGRRRSDEELAAQFGVDPPTPDSDLNSG